MPIPVPIMAAMITGGAGLAAQGINVANQTGWNKKQAAWNEKMWAWQREAALADMMYQNEYNSPVEQMKRLRQAGLNPNLVYGNGGAITQAAGIRSSDTKQWSPHAPQIDPRFVGETIGTYYDTQMKEAQIDLLKTQNTVAQENAKLKNIQTAIGVAKEAETWNSVRKGDFDLGLKYDLRQNSLDYAVGQLKKLQMDTMYTQHQDQRANEMNKAQIAEIAGRLSNMMYQGIKTQAETRMVNQQIYNMIKDGTLKDLDIMMKNKGMTWNDPLWQRQISQAWNDPQKLSTVVKNFIERFRNAP